MIFLYYLCQYISMKKQEIGSRLKELRLERGLTQVALAEILKIDKSTIAKYETNKIEPSISMLIAFVEFFQVSADYILGLVD